MSGTIVHALNWDNDYEQQFIAVNPMGDEVLLYQTNHNNDPTVESDAIIQLNSRSGFENIQCSSYSKINRGLVGVGSINGTISIFDINSPTSSSLSLRPKQNRPCNSISFNHNNLIVAGFDKGRQDNSLQIWNIETYSSTSGGNNNHIKRPLSTYLPNEAILSATFYPDRESSIVCGSYKFLREIDLRSDQPAFQMATKCTLGLTIDHFDNHLFQSFSEDGSLAIWDRRKLTTIKSKSLSSGNVITETPILQFNKLLSDASSRKISHPCVKYSTIRRGEFAAVFNGDLIRRWHTGRVPSDYSITPMSESSSYRFTTNETNTLQGLKQQASQLYKPSQDSLFVSMVLDVKTDYERVVSFDYSPDITSHTSTNFVCMRQSGSVFRMPVVECIEAMDFNVLNEFSIAGPEGTMTKFIDLTKEQQQQQQQKQKQQEPDTATKMNRNRSLSVARIGGISPDRNEEFSEDVSSTVDDESDVPKNNNTHHQHQLTNQRLSFDAFEEIPLNTFLDSSDIISNDICAIIRKRANLGYAFDCDFNISLLERLDTMDNQLFLRNTWKWLSLARKSLEKGTMISEGIDLGFQGVLGIWKGVEELEGQNRSDGTVITDSWFSQAVRSIVSSKGKKTAAINIPRNSEKKPQRKLALIVSGWYLADNEFEEKLDMLVSLGDWEKAAGWAVFHGDVPKAIEILANSQKERLRLIATAVAGYLAYKNSNVNSPWKDQCRKMASELDNPYLRAIFAFIADDDWWDVLDEHALPLRERLGVALRFLSDKDLSVYLDRIADSVVNKGELEGLILTGITPRGIDLLQSYVDRTSDIQTAGLIASYTCPRYFNDQRITHWIDCYRNLLNRWGFFSIRGKFDVTRTKLSKTFKEQITIKATPKQVFLQCTRCNKNMAKFKTPTLNNQALMKQFNKLNGKTITNDIVNCCPHCGAPLPRCAICLLTLGTPIPFEPNERLDENDRLGNKIENKFREWFSYCLTCNHSCHAYHAQEWFAKHYVCPVPDCNCRCNTK